MSNNNKQRTYARKRMISRKGKENINESDASYLLKLVLVLLLGTFWLKFSNPLTFGNFALAGFPVGLVIGLILINKFEKFQFNRKIWYATLLVVTVISFFVPAGVLL